MAQAIAEGGTLAAREPKDPAKLSRLLVVFLYVDAAVAGFAALGDILDLGFLSSLAPNARTSFGSALPGEDLVGLLQGVAGLAQIILFGLCGFLSLKWVYRTSLNAHSLSPGMSNSPGWSVGWFFVPFVNLWKPFQGVRETWQVSADPATWRSQPTPGLLRLWWGLWLVTNILGNIAFRLETSATTVGELTVSGGIALAQDALSIPLDLCFLLIVRRICSMQVDALSRRVFD